MMGLDPLNPGDLLTSTGNNFDSASGSQRLYICSPSEGLQNGIVTSELHVVFSPERFWLLYPNFSDAVATVTGTTGPLWTPVQAAATRLGITDGAVRQLISRRVLASRRPTPTSAHRLSSADVEAYAVVREQREPVRAPRDTTLPPPPVSAALEARVGSHPGASFRIKGAQVAGQKISTWREGTIPAGWTQIAILAAKGSKGARCWVLEPADSANAVDFEGFYVHGPFKVTETINNERAARERFERFQPKTTED